jgi:hypothetical protein
MVLILCCVFFLLGCGWAVVSLALICSFAKMRSHLGLDATVKEDSVPETTVLAVTKVLRFSAALRVSEDGKQAVSPLACGLPDIKYSCCVANKRKFLAKGQYFIFSFM